MRRRTAIQHPLNRRLEQRFEIHRLVAVDEFDLRLDVPQMMIHVLRRLLAIAAFERLSDFQVLTMGAGHGAR